MNKEIGGYLELENFHGKHYHDNAIKLNCGRSALMYALILNNVKKIFIPDFMCDVIKSACEYMNVSTEMYSISENFVPDYVSFCIKDEWLFLADYYGQLTEKDVKKAYNFSGGKLIIDECQGFFRQPWKDIDTIYSCRKFLGVPDGGYLYSKSDLVLDENFKEDRSFPHSRYLFGRYEYSARDYFQTAQTNNERFDNQPIMRMSKLTNNLLKAIDYERIIKKRDDNFKFLHENLSHKNKLELNPPYGAFMYPFMVKDATGVREKLANKDIFIPTLWPNVVEDEVSNSIAYNFAQNILPLPVDQRYNIDDMKVIIKELESCLK